MKNTIINLAAAAADSARVERLRCESLENPLGMDDAKPRLSWKLEDPRRGARQTANQVICASASDVLAQDRGDLWDSGKIESDQSPLVPYAGNPLSSGQIVYWKVKVWDKDGRESPSSEPARWEMGLLSPED